MRRNVTLSLEEDVIRRVRVLAARRGESISALLRSELERLVAEEDRFLKASESALKRLKRGRHLGGLPLPTREELHDRENLR
ncbi:MAG: ribbon-helix-helix protein, CopG family [Deltaproteobacteria bacterium]|nr:ribbon-helix-helix protein, CopG family [Deltaproteobacteria bacterium]